MAITGCWPLVSNFPRFAFGKGASYTWQLIRGKVSVVRWGGLLAIHDTSPNATRFLHAIVQRHPDSPPANFKALAKAIK